MVRSAAAIKRKYGAKCFEKWGGKTGGSPVLKAWSEGKIPKKYVRTKKS